MYLVFKWVSTFERARRAGDEASRAVPQKNRKSGRVDPKCCRSWGDNAFRSIITHLLKRAQHNTLPGSAERNKP